MQKNLNWLKVLQCCDKSELKGILKQTSATKVNALCDCIHNVLNGNVPIDSTTKEKLKTKKKVLRKVIDKKIKVPERRKLLVQHGGGIISSILVPTLLALGAKVLSR